MAVSKYELQRTSRGSELTSGMYHVPEASDVLCLKTKDGGAANLLHLAGADGPVVLVLPANGFPVKCYTTLVSSCRTLTLPTPCVRTASFVRVPEQCRRSNSPDLSRGASAGESSFVGKDFSQLRLATYWKFTRATSSQS